MMAQMDGANVEFISYVRQCLRIINTIFDDEISDLILAAKADLLLGGIIPDKVNNDNDPLIRRAVVCYVKAEFGLDNPDAERYRDAYQSIRKHLMLSSEYLGDAEDVLE